jgi:hypothetical protein
MNDQEPTYVTTPIEEADAKSGFSCGKHPLDDYLARHALANDRRGIGRAFVLRRAASDPPELPVVIGFYTLSMARRRRMLPPRAIARRTCSNPPSRPSGWKQPASVNATGCRNQRVASSKA